MTIAASDLPNITVNGRAIPQNTLAALLNEHAGAEGEDGLKEAATALVIRELLLQQAENTGLAEDTTTLDDAGMDVLIDQLLDRDVPPEEAPAADVERYYRENEEKFVTPPQIELSHILLGSAPDDTTARQQASLEASGLIGQLAQGADFAELARKYSTCPSRDQGGALGEIAAGQTVPEFEQQVFTLPEGLSQDPIETRFGHHIVRIDRRVDGQPVSFDEAREHIGKFLRDGKRHHDIRQYLQALFDKAEISGIDLRTPGESQGNPA